MPIDTLGEEVHSAIRGATDYLKSNHQDENIRLFHYRNLQASEKRLADDITERSTTYLVELNTKETNAIDEIWTTLNKNQKCIRLLNESKAYQQSFDSLRHINGGTFPRHYSTNYSWRRRVVRQLLDICSCIHSCICDCRHFDCCHGICVGQPYARFVSQTNLGNS